MMESTSKSSISADLNDFINKVSKNIRIIDAFLVGSAAELPLEYLLSTPDDLTIDQLKFQWNECAVPRGSIPAAGFNGTIFHVEPIARRPGYAWLMHSGATGNSWYVSSSHEITAPRRWTGRTTRKQMTLVDRYDMNEFLLSQHPLARQLMAYKCFSMHVHTSVICFHWPSEAAEWGTRTRAHGWPSEALVKSVTAAGCHLTPCIDRKKSPYEGGGGERAVFRYAFSVAEVMLIRTWNHVQRYIYHILLLIKKDAVKQLRARGHDSVIDTYHFKTLMLWACETRPAEFWEKTNIRSSVGELLCQMIEYLVEKSCPNYFMPTNNLFERLTENLDLEAEISPLLVYKEQGASRLIASIPMTDPEKTSTFLFSSKVLNVGYIGLRHVNLRPWSKISTSSVRRNELIDLPDRTEFEHLYNGVKSHLGLALTRNNLEVHDSSESRNSDRIGKTVHCFEQAMRNETSSRHSISVCLGNTLSELISSIFKISNCSETEDGDLESNSAQNSEDDLGHTKKSDSTKDEAASSTVNDSMKNTSTSCGSNHEVKAGPQHSGFQTVLGLCMNAILPTIDKQLPKATYLISAAYRANFYHTYVKNYQMCLRVCEEALKHTRRGKFTLVSTFSDQACSLVLSRKFVPIFDKHIQVIYGFLTLARTLRNSWSTSHTSVEKQSASVAADPLLYLSPGDFLQYMKLQCERRLLYCSPYSQLESMLQFRYSPTYRSPEILYAALIISDARSRTQKLQLPSWDDAVNRPQYWT